jgi:hypothetical protein
VRRARCWGIVHGEDAAGRRDEECNMSKGLDKKKEQKKKPAKSLEEKRAAKREKKESRG